MCVVVVWLSFICVVVVLICIVVVLLCVVVVVHRNHSGVDSVSRLVVQPHLGPVYSACFSHDGSKIASCGASNMLRVGGCVSALGSAGQCEVLAVVYVCWYMCMSV